MPLWRDVELPPSAVRAFATLGSFARGDGGGAATADFECAGANGAQLLLIRAIAVVEHLMVLKLPQAEVLLVLALAVDLKL